MYEIISARRSLFARAAVPVICYIAVVVVVFVVVIVNPSQPLNFILHTFSAVV